MLSDYGTTSFQQISVIIKGREDSLKDDFASKFHFERKNFTPIILLL